MSRRLFRIASASGARFVVEDEGTVHEVIGDPFSCWQEGPELPGGLGGRQILAPVLPSKIVAVGLNYRAHAVEQGKPLPAEPLIFIKPSTAVIGPYDPIRLPPGVGRVDHEAEAGIVIGRRASRVSAEDASRVILGVTCVNDVTARELQRREGHYTRPKGFDTFAPIGPAIALDRDYSNLTVRAWVNDELRQDSSTRDLIFRVPDLVAFISAIMTLLPGDIISTGTPAGIGPIRSGDTVRVEVGGVGALVNPVVEMQGELS
jgi:2-keto-4-pentenoate hydratase/2-oxohepta-3-ene-1,7-dioic acid hydratase in catechol pathway